MLSPVPERVASVPHALYRPFVFWDCESIGVVAVLLGLFHLFMVGPMYYADISLHLVYLLPLLGGIVCVTAGCLTIACVKRSTVLMLKGCAYTNMVSVLAALCGVCVYRVSLGALPIPCNNNTVEDFRDRCLKDQLSGFFTTLATLVFVYDLASLIVHGLLSFCALKGLKTI